MVRIMTIGLRGVSIKEEPDYELGSKVSPIPTTLYVGSKAYKVIADKEVPMITMIEV